MDHLQRTSYEKDFRIAFLESKGDGFQRLFEKLMFKVHPNDFLACRPGVMLVIKRMMDTCHQLVPFTKFTLPMN